MKRLMTTVTNAVDGKQYFVSTVRCRRSGGWQSAVFRKIFGPFANFRRPQGFFLGVDAAYLHARVTALARDVDPVAWDSREIFVSAEADEADAAFNAMIAQLRG